MAGRRVCRSQEPLPDPRAARLQCFHPPISYDARTKLARPPSMRPVVIRGAVSWMTRGAGISPSCPHSCSPGARPPPTENLMTRMTTRMIRLLCLLWTFACCMPVAAAGRERLSLDQGWLFHPGDVATYPIRGHGSSYYNGKADGS